MENTELIKIENLNAQEVFAQNGVGSLIDKVKAAYVPKLPADTEEGREERRSMAYAIAKLKNSVDGMGKEYVADLKKAAKDIDQRRKKWRDEVEQYQADVRRPLTEYEEAEARRIADHNAAMNKMRELMAYDYEPDSADIEGRIEQVKELQKRDYEEFADQAKTIAENSIGRLGEKLAHQVKAEAEKAELERLRKLEEEQKEKERQAELQRQADERAAAKAKADLEAANARADAAEKKVAEVQKTAPQTAPTPPPASENSDKETRRAVNSAIVEALIDSCMISESAAKAVVTAILQNKIPSVTINYERNQ